MKRNRNGILLQAQLHIVVFIFGFSAIFGKLIRLEAVELVFFRTLFAFATLFFWNKAKTINCMERGEMWKSLGVGLIVAAHWLTFFHAIKVSNVSVALGCLGISSLFASLIEPLFDRRKISFFDFVFAIVILFGVYLIFQFEFRFMAGIIFATVSAFLASLFSVLNKYLSKKSDIRRISLFETATAAVVTLLFVLIRDRNFPVVQHLQFADWLFLFLLGTIGTAYAFTQSIRLVGKLSAFQVLLTVNLEPVYGILLALLIFGKSEMMSGGFYAGASIILLGVVFYSILKNPRKAHSA